MHLWSSITSGFPDGRAVARRIAVTTGGLLLTALAAAPALADISTPIFSGLPWRSGTTAGGFPCLAQLRGRTLDVVTTFVPPTRGSPGW